MISCLVFIFENPGTYLCSLPWSITDRLHLRRRQRELLLQSGVRLLHTEHPVDRQPPKHIIHTGGKEQHRERRPQGIIKP
jgi:hypothetical protein